MNLFIQLLQYKSVSQEKKHLNFVKIMVNFVMKIMIAKHFIVRIISAQQKPEECPAQCMLNVEEGHYAIVKPIFAQNELKMDNHV